jgi:antitoxin component YwqK of YwqJK toxin-antitoxin module
MKIIITEEQKKKLFIPITESEESKKGKLFIPRRLSGENSRFIQWNKEQPIVDGVQINQYTHDGKKTGIWEEYFPNGQLSSKGLYENNKKTGVWESYHYNGQLESKGLYKDGNRDGIWESYHDNGKLDMRGSFKDDKKDGIWEKYWDNGQLWSKGSYENDKRDGIWESYYDNGQLWSKGSFKDGNRDGIWEEYYDDGNLEYRRLFKDGKLIKKLPITESEESKKGKLFIPRRLSGENSRFIQWNKEQPIVDGVQINQFTHNGKKTGIWGEYYDNGQLRYKGSFKDGEEDGIWEDYYKNGQLLSKQLFKNGLGDGIWESYHYNGQLDMRGSFKNGKEDGIWESYYSNGQLSSKGSFKNGKQDGIWENYYTNGQLEYRRLYNNGVYNIMETIKASEACDNLNSIKTLEDGKRGIAWVQINDIDDREKKYILKSINKNDFGFITVKENPYKPIIIYRNGYGQNAEELARIASKYDGYLSGKATYEDSKRIGELLEYDPEDIQTYLNKLYTNKTLNEGQVYSYKLNSSHSDPNKREIIYNFTNKDNYEFEVVFYNLGKNKWEREYRTTKKGLGILNTNDVYNIMETVTNITIDFIEMYEPNKIIITHIHKNKEIDFNKPNKRALLNKRYLKPAIDKLDDYFYSLNRSTSIIKKI